MRIQRVMFSIENTSIKKASKIKNSGNVSVPKYDNAYISPLGKDLCFVKKVLSETPDIREDKVKELKEKIENGNYEISPEQIAEKMLEKAFTNNIV